MAQTYGRGNFAYAYLSGRANYACKQVGTAGPGHPGDPAEQLAGAGSRKQGDPNRTLAI